MSNPLLPSLESVLRDPDVMEILIDGYNRIYVDKRGVYVDIPTPYQNNDHLLAEIMAMASTLGRQVNEDHPIADFRLMEDGSRIHVVLPPVSLNGPVMNIRKYLRKPLTLDELLGYGCLSEDMAQFLRACVLGRINIGVCGGSGAGKTSVQNILCQMIPDDERIITVEHSAEIRLEKKRRVALETRSANLDGRGEITMRDLISSATKMRPDRIVVGELQGGEVIDMLLAINTGYDGSIFNMHANGPRDALSRLEVMATTGNPTLPLLAVREQITTAIQLLTCQELMRDGTRRIVRVTEILGLQDDQIQTQDIFEFRQTGYRDGKIIGHYSATGLVPRFLTKIRNANVEIPMHIFEPHP
ncbi:MAG: CpaF family protein [Chloroflexi bacterium]|nr:CpaF family protein [Chloroflexota bacterium]